MKKTIILVVVMILIYMFPLEVLTVSPQDYIHSQPKSAARNTVPVQYEPVVPSVVAAEAVSGGKSTTEYNVIGYSFEGNIIHDVVITPTTYDRTMLITFAMHGFEGAWDSDGAMLVQIANDVIRQFSSRPEELNTTRLIVVPCVNPDGILHGQTSNGFGRCNSQGLDINRDFDYHWEFSDDSRYHTGNAPFATPEAQILRDLVLVEKPDIVIDFHGWLACTYGDKELGDYFNQALGIEHQGATLKDTVYMQKYFTGWASQFARTIMVEYPDPQNPQNVIDWQYSYHTINAIRNICNYI